MPRNIIRQKIKANKNHPTSWGSYNKRKSSICEFISETNTTRHVCEYRCGTKTCWEFRWKTNTEVFLHRLKVETWQCTYRITLKLEFSNIGISYKAKYCSNCWYAILILYKSNIFLRFNRALYWESKQNLITWAILEFSQTNKQTGNIRSISSQEGI